MLRHILVDFIKIKEKELRAHGGCLWLSEAMKDVISCEKLR